MLEPSGIKKWLTKKEPPFAKEIAYLRYHIARQPRDWTTQQWLRVWLSDKCSLKRGAYSMRKYVLRISGPRLDRDQVTNQDKIKSIGVMV
jgi:hypothetical protein